MPHYMSDDMFLLLVVTMIGLVILAVLLAFLLFFENKRARHTTKMLQESRLHAFELDPDNLAKSNDILRDRIRKQEHLLTYGQMLTQSYADYCATLEGAKAVAAADNPAKVQLVHPATGLPLRKPQPEAPFDVPMRMSEPIGLGS